MVGHRPPSWWVRNTLDMKNPSGKTKAMEEEQTFLSPSHGLIPTPAGKTWHPPALQVSGHAESFQKFLPGTPQPSCQEHRSVSLNSALKSSVQTPDPLPWGRHCKEPSYLLSPKGCFLSQKPKLKVRSSGLQPDICQVQEQSLCLRVNFNFCGFFFSLNMG